MSISLSAFNIRPEFIEQYDEYVSVGLETCIESNILYIGLARNLEDVINKNIEYLYKHKNLFKNLDIFIYENDSIDNTKLLLQQANQKYSLHYISEDLNTKQYGPVKNKDRIILLSNYRNKSIEQINKLIKNNTIKKPDYIVVIDLDFHKFHNEGIIHSIGWMTKNYDTKACAGNSFQPKTLGNYDITWNYDSWAFRLNWWDDLAKYNNNTHQDLMYWFGLWIPPVGSDPIKVNSAFGGSCIYKSEYYLQAQYDSYDCEHVCLHKYLYNKFTDFELRLNPSQIMFFE